MSYSKSVTTFRRSTDQALRDKFIVERSGQFIAIENSEESARERAEVETTASVNALLKDAFPSLSIPHAYVASKMDSMAIYHIVEEYFSENLIDISCLVPTAGEMEDFYTETKKLTRPYFALSEEQYETLHSLNTDFFVTPSGAKVTFGHASTHNGKRKYALMPYIDDSKKDHFLKIN